MSLESVLNNDLPGKCFGEKTTTLLFWLKKNKNNIIISETQKKNHFHYFMISHIKNKKKEIPTKNVSSNAQNWDTKGVNCVIDLLIHCVKSFNCDFNHQNWVTKVLKFCSKVWIAVEKLFFTTPKTWIATSKVWNASSNLLSTTSTWKPFFWC